MLTGKNWGQGDMNFIKAYDMNIFRAMRLMSVLESSGLFYIDATYTVASCLLGQVHSSVTHNSDRDLKFLSLRHSAFPRDFEKLWGGWSYAFFFQQAFGAYFAFSDNHWSWQLSKKCHERHKA